MKPNDVVIDVQVVKDWNWARRMVKEKYHSICFWWHDMTTTMKWMKGMSGFCFGTVMVYSFQSQYGYASIPMLVLMFIYEVTYEVERQRHKNSR